MRLPVPEPGLVISYAYLWCDEHRQGFEEGRKTRPCIILAVEHQDGATLVTVAPITHSEPTDEGKGISLPLRVKQHLGLDDLPSWVIVGEANRFIWPGYDLRPVPPNGVRCDYGFVPPKLFVAIKTAVLDLVQKRRRAVAPRD